MNFLEAFDNIHEKIIANHKLQLFTAFTRVLLAIGFIPPSITKIMNVPFTILPDSNPVGHYFNALYQTGYYYQFIGWGQLIAALFLLFPRTAHLGALMFFPIIANITVLTNSVDFAGTKYITTLMLVACTYLLFWEYDRLKPLLFQRSVKTQSSKFGFLLLPCLFASCGAVAALLVNVFNVGNLHKSFMVILGILTLLGFLSGLVCALHHKFMKVGKLENSSGSVEIY